MVPPQGKAELIATRADKVSMVTLIAPGCMEERTMVEVVIYLICKEGEKKSGGEKKEGEIKLGCNTLARISCNAGDGCAKICFISTHSYLPEKTCFLSLVLPEMNAASFHYHCCWALK